MFKEQIRMLKFQKKWLGTLNCILLILVFVSACTAAPTQAPVDTEIVYPTVFITQYVTQVVATSTVTPILPPTKQVQVITPAASTGWDPFKVDIYYPLRGCVASRLHIDDVAFVAGGPVGLYISANISDSPTYRNLEPGELIDIEGGPSCFNNMLIWKVGTGDKMVGYTPEGNGDNYWLLPMPPTTDEVITKKDVKEVERKKIQ
jgi:hypothetical protein